MAEIQAKFVSHRITPAGIYIQASISGPGLFPDVEVFVSHEDAVLFGWVDEDGDPDEDEDTVLEIMGERDKKKLEEWNSLSTTRGRSA